MRSFHQWLSVALLASCLYSADSAAASGVPVSTGVFVESVPSKVPDQKVPDQDAVEAFTRQAEWDFPGYGEGKGRVSDRILDGFEAAPTLLVTTDGSSIRWGSKFQESIIESVVIGDHSGRLELLAAVDGMTRLTSLSRSPIDSMAEYEQRQKRSGMEPSVTVFVHDEDDLSACFPLFKRWLQASLTGFNADCGKAEFVSACKLARQITIPIKVYVIAADGSLHGVKAPQLRASAIPLKAFVQ